MERDKLMRRLDEADIQELSKLYTSDLQAMQAALAAEEAKLKARKERLQVALERKFSVPLTPGTHVMDDGVKVEVPKLVDWDQEKMAEIAAMIRIKWQGDPSDYIDSKLSVAEGRYKGWPSDLQKIFEPARTVRTGKLKFIFATAKQDAA